VWTNAQVVFHQVVCHQVVCVPIGCVRSFKIQTCTTMRVALLYFKYTKPHRRHLGLSCVNQCSSCVKSNCAPSSCVCPDWVCEKFQDTILQHCAGESTQFQIDHATTSSPRLELCEPMLKLCAIKWRAIKLCVCGLGALEVTKHNLAPLCRRLFSIASSASQTTVTPARIVWTNSQVVCNQVVCNQVFLWRLGC
jgi:hypothetical protein